MPSRSTLSQCRCTLQISTREAKVNTVHLQPSLLFSLSVSSPLPPLPLSLHLSVSPALSVSLFSVSHTNTHSQSLYPLSLFSLCVCLHPSLSLPPYIILIIRVIRCKSQYVTLISLI